MIRTSEVEEVDCSAMSWQRVRRVEVRLIPFVWGLVVLARLIDGSVSWWVAAIAYGVVEYATWAVWPRTGGPALEVYRQPIETP